MFFFFFQNYCIPILMHLENVFVSELEGISECDQGRNQNLDKEEAEVLVNTNSCF